MECILYMKNGKVKRYKKVKDFLICANNPELYGIHVAIVGGSKWKRVKISECERFIIKEENVKV